METTTTLTTVLEMTFRLDNDKNATISVANPKDDLTATTVKAAMNAIILDSIFDYDGAEMVAPASAKLVKKEISEVF